jgi:hypothetical protein
MNQSSNTMELDIFFKNESACTKTRTDIVYKR